MSKQLAKGEVRNLLRQTKPKAVVIDGKPVRVKAKADVSVYKDRWGRYTVIDKGRRLTADEKKLGLKRARGKEAEWIRAEYAEYGPQLRMQKTSGGPQNRFLRGWNVNGLKGWVNVKQGDFISKDYPTHLGDMERLMRSLSRTQYARAHHVNLETMWRKLNKEQQFNAMSKLINVNWDNFFETYIDSKGVGSDGAVNMELQEEGIRMVQDILRSV